MPNAETTESRALAQPRFSGVVEGLPAEEYHDGPEMSSTGLGHVLRSIPHYLAFKAEGIDTKALKIGRAVHTLALEGQERFFEEFVVRPDGDLGNFRKKDGQAWRDEQIANGLHILTRDEAVSVREMAEAIHAHPLLESLFDQERTESFRELSLFWVDEDTGVHCRARCDYYAPGLGMVIDLKSTQDARETPFRRSVDKYGYYRQWAFYRRGLLACGLRADAFVFAAFEKARPYGVQLWHLDNTYLDQGDFEVNEALFRWSQYLETGEPSGYPVEIQTLEPWRVKNG